jgi:hypothetical protein
MRASRRAVPLLFLAALLLAALGPDAAWAQESSRGDAPTPDTAEELAGPLQSAFEVEPRPTARIPALEKLRNKLPPFFRDTELTFRFRTFYWDEEKIDDTKPRALTIGGALVYESGPLAEYFTIGSALYFSEPLWAPSNGEGTGLLRPGQEGYIVAGQAWGRIRYAKQSLQLYRQVVDLPYVNKADTRMTPNTFEAYMLRGTLPELPGLGRVNYVLGWIDKIRLRDQEDFVPMSEAAGVPGGDDGMFTTTLRSRPNDQSYFGVTNHFVPNTFNTFYSEASYVRSFERILKYPLDHPLGFRFEGQVTWQRGVGAERLGAFDALNFSWRTALSYRGAIFTLATSVTGDDGEIQKPWGLFPGYLGLMQSDFDRPGEAAWLMGLSYDFEKVGVPGLSAFVNYAEGFNGALPGTSTEADERAFDATIDYKPTKGWYRDIWLRVRGSWRNVPGEGTSTQVRIILNYDFPIL